MNRYFIDSSYLIALAHQPDQWHERALRWSKVARGRFWTTDFVLLELADGLALAKTRLKALDAIDDLLSDRRVRIVEASRALLQRGFDLYRSRADKDWSLTDCISFVVMSDEGLLDALTHDHHFEQAGFRALLRLSPPTANGP